MAKVGSAEIEFDLDTKGFEAEINATERELQRLVKAYDTTKNMKPFKGQQEDLEEIGIQLEKTRNKLTDLKAKQDKLDYGKPTESIQKHDRSLNNIIKKVTKWGLAIFGIRSAYHFVRQAASTISQYDKQIGTDIEYIRYALAFTLKPIIEWLVKAVFTILQYVGAIIYRLTGYNIFKNSGVKGYQKSMASAEKSSKKIKDNFSAAFDEFNKIDKQDSGGSAGSGGVGTPSMDLSELKQIELPAWLNKVIDFIKKHKGIVLKVIGAIMGLLLFNKVISWIAPLGSVLGLFTGGSLISGAKGFLSTLGTIAVTAGGIAMVGYSIYDLLEGNKKQGNDINKITKKGLDYAKEDAKNFKNLDELQEALNYKREQSNKILDKSNTFSAWLTGTSDDLLDNMYGIVEQQDIYLQEQINAYKQGKLNKQDQEKLKKILLEQTDYLTVFGDRLDAQGKDSKYIRDMGAQYRDILGEMGVMLDNMGTPFDKIKQDSKYIKENTGNIVKDIASIANKNTIKLRIEADAKSAGLTLKELATNFAKVITAPLNAIGAKGLSDMIMSKVKALKLASGAIINQPGRGVPIMNAITGEAGREGILPLTDSQAMAQLGQEIGKWVAINNVIDVNMDSKRINRILKNSQNTSNFANNR